VPSLESQIQTILRGTDRYEEKSIPTFEKYILHQINAKKFNLEATLALVKLYQFYPDKLNLPTLELLLAQSLMYMDDLAFSLALFMIPEIVQSTENIVKLSMLAESLETAQYGDFWTKLADSKAIIGKVPGFEDALRTFILEILTRAYKTINKQFLAQSLGLKDKSLAQYLGTRKWKDDGTNVVFPDGTQPVAKNVSQSVQFDQLIKILQTLK